MPCDNKAKCHPSNAIVPKKLSHSMRMAACHISKLEQWSSRWRIRWSISYLNLNLIYDPKCKILWLNGKPTLRSFFAQSKMIFETLICSQCSLEKRKWNVTPLSRHESNFFSLQHFIAPSLNLMPCLSSWLEIIACLQSQGNKGSNKIQYGPIQQNGSKEESKVFKSFLKTYNFCLKL